MSKNKKLYFFTFGGFAEDDKYTNCVQPILASSWENAREVMVKHFGTKWAFQYTESQYRKNKRDIAEKSNNLGVYIPPERELPAIEAD